MTKEQRQQKELQDNIYSIDMMTEMRLKFEICRGNQGNMGFIKEWLYNAGHDRVGLEPCQPLEQLGRAQKWLVSVAAEAGNANVVERLLRAKAKPVRSVSHNCVQQHMTRTHVRHCSRVAPL